jgi:hypothetical protein
MANTRCCGGATDYVRRQHGSHLPGSYSRRLTGWRIRAGQRPSGVIQPAGDGHINFRLAPLKRLTLLVHLVGGTLT